MTVSVPTAVLLRVLRSPTSFEQDVLTRHKRGDGEDAGYCLVYFLQLVVGNSI